MKRSRIPVLTRIVRVACMLGVATATYAQPSADQVLTDFGLSADDRQRVMHGEYVSHAFTDQVAGTGGSLKRSIGSRIMADKLKEMFDAGRRRIER